MQHVMIEGLVESLRMKWEDAKWKKLEYYIANVNSECWSRYKARMPIDSIQPYLITNMSSNARRGLTLLHTRSHKLGIEVASRYQNVTNLKACKVCNEGVVEGECHLLFAWSAYSAIRSRYDNILRGSDNLSAILKTPPRRLSSYVYMLYSHIETLCSNVSIPPLRKETHIKNTCILWSHTSKLASLWTIKILILILSFHTCAYTHTYTHTRTRAHLHKHNNNIIVFHPHS